MAREADGVLYTQAGPEIGVAATKTHLTQIVALEFLALVLAQARQTMTVAASDEMMEKLRDCPTSSTRCSSARRTWPRWPGS